MTASAQKHIYLDYNATAPIRPAVREVMAEAMGLPANPSSVHWFGREAKKRLEQARKTIADTVSCFPQEIVFTASGTEANNLAIKSFPDSVRFVSAIEHSSVLQAAEGAEQLPVDGDGIININDLKEKLKNKTSAFISIMLANNETGVVQPIREIAAIIHDAGGLLHVDAVQVLGKMPIDMGLLGADLMTISAHKMGGPVGAAALIARQNIPLKKQMQGGGQESGRRGGTENLAAIMGFAKAVELVHGDDWQKGMRVALDKLEDEALASVQGARIMGKAAERLPNTSALLMPGVSAETQLMRFDLESFAVSAGSACSSGRIEPSHVLRAMGLSESEAGSVIRVSAGWDTKPEEIATFSKAWQKIASDLAQAA